MSTTPCAALDLLEGLIATTTVTALAREIGCSPQLVHAWRAGRSRPNRGHTLALERLGVPAASWLTDDDERRRKEACTACGDRASTVYLWVTLRDATGRVSGGWWCGSCWRSRWASEAAQVAE